MENPLRRHVCSDSPLWFKKLFILYPWTRLALLRRNFAPFWSTLRRIAEAKRI